MPVKKILPLAIAFTLLLPACSWFQPKPQMSQLEVREIQTRTFDTKDVKRVMKALLDVLQDEGFIVKSTDTQLGFLSAAKEKDLGYGGRVNWSTIGQKNEPERYRKTSIIETTANVTEFGDGCRVRVNFQEKVLDNFGAIVEVNQLLDQAYYQDFFSKVDKGIFIQKEKI